MIRTTRYVDADDLSPEAKDAYREFCCECGVYNGQPWSWEVGEFESVPESWIGTEKCSLVDECLRSFGLKDGESIDIIFEW